MSVRVIVHHPRTGAEPAGWDVEVIRPRTATLVREEDDDQGHVIEFQIPPATRSLVYRRVASDDPARSDDVEFTIPAGPGRHEFWAGGQPPEAHADGAEPKEQIARNADKDVDEDADELRKLLEKYRVELEAVTGQVRSLEERVSSTDGLDARVQALETRPGMAELADLPDVEDTVAKLATTYSSQAATLDEVRAKVDNLGGLPGLADVPKLPALEQDVAELADSVTDLPEQRARIKTLRRRVRKLDLLRYRVESLEQRSGVAVVVPQRPVTGNVADLAHRAEVATLQIRDGFYAAQQDFIVRSGLDPAKALSGENQEPAARTARLLAVAAATAATSADRYVELQNDPQKRESLTRDTFVGEVRRAGAFYASTVDDAVSDAAQATTADSTAFAELVTDLRNPPFATAVEAAVNFTD